MKNKLSIDNGGGIVFPIEIYKVVPIIHLVIELFFKLNIDISTIYFKILLSVL